MRAGRIVIRVVLVVVLILLVTAAVLYWQASKLPDAYEPAELTGEERRRAARDFYGHIFSGDESFNSIAQKTTPGQWRITPKQLNEYLASMDEIAAFHPGGRAGDVQKQMDEAGISAPAAALGDGVLTLMFRARDYNKIVSADLTFSYTDDRKLRVRLAQARVGKLPIPAGLVRDRLAGLKQAFSRRASRGRKPKRAAVGRGRKDEGATAEDLGQLMAVLIAAIDEEPIEPEFYYRAAHKRVRISAIRIEPELATLEVTPLGRGKRKKG